MNDNTTKLIEQLAQKLGTTSEYLWSVLLKQAPVSSVISIIQLVAIGLFGYVLVKLHRKFSAPIEDDSYNENLYDKRGPAIAIPMVVGGIMFLIFSIVGFFAIEDIFNGFYNPEYWAIERIACLFRSHSK